MNFIEFIKSKLIGRKSYEVDSKTFDEFLEETLETSKFHLYEIALYTAIDLIARTLSKCEFVTVVNHEEYYGDEYYLWNIQPNKHQTKTEFLIQFFSKLIFENEALIFETADRQQLLVADSFGKTEYAIFEDTYSGITARGYTLEQTLKSSKVIVLKYSNVALRHLLGDMCKAYQELITAAEERYRESTGHKGILEISTAAQGDNDFEKNFNDLLQNRFKQYFNAKNAVLPLYNGFKYSEPTTKAGKTTNSEINDITKLKAEAVSAVGNALHIPPALITGEASQLSDAESVFISDAIDPLAQMLGQEITAKRYGVNNYKKGNYLFIDTTYARHIDAISCANNLDKAIASSILNPYKAQKYCNMLPSKEDWAKEYQITKNYQTQSAAKGGDE